MIYTLDINAITAFLTRRGDVARIFEGKLAAGHDVTLNAISYFELKRGLMLPRFAGKLTELEVFAGGYELLPLDMPALNQAVTIYQMLRAEVGCWRILIFLSLPSQWCTTPPSSPATSITLSVSKVRASSPGRPEMFSMPVNDGLELHLLEHHHAQMLFDLTAQNREHLRPYLPWVPKMQAVAQTEAFIKMGLEQFARHDGFQAGVFLRGELVGMVGLHYVRWDTERTELGYWLAEDAQGQGVATRVVRALCDYCFGELKLGHVEIRCAPRNARSRRVPERLGFTEEGTLRRMDRLEDGWSD